MGDDMNNLFGNLFGSLSPTNDPLMGEYYNPKAAIMRAIGGGLQGAGAGLASGKPGAWAQGFTIGSAEGLDKYKDETVKRVGMSRMLEEADAKKQERARTEAERKRRDDFIAKLPPDQRMKAMSIPGYLEKLVEATDPAFQEVKDPADYLKVVGDSVYDTRNGQWIQSPGGGQGDLPKGYRWKQDGTGAEPIPGVTIPGTPKPYVPGSTDRTAARNAKEENTLLQQTLVNLDEATKLVGVPDTSWKPAPGQTEADRPIIPSSNSGFFSTGRAVIAENVKDGLVPDSIFGSPQQGANTLRLKQIMDAEALASMGKLLKGPTSDRDVRIMLETVNDPNASPKRKQASIDQVKRIIRAQIAANEESIIFSLEGPNAGSGTGGGDVPDGLTPEEWGALTPEEQALWR